MALFTPMAATPTPASSATATPFSSALRRRPVPTLNFLSPPTSTPPGLAVCLRFFPPKTSYGASLARRVRASEPEREGDPSTLAPIPNSISISTFQEDANYVWKLAIGSVIGAAMIKYGSIVLPGMTRPDIVQALLMISAPMVASVILLVLGSRDE